MGDDTRRGPGGTGRTPASGRTPHIPRPRREPPPTPRHRSEPAPRDRRTPADDTPIYPLPGGWPDPDPDAAAPPAGNQPRPPAHARWRRLALILIMIGMVVVALLSLRTVLGAAAADPGRPPVPPHPAAGCHTAGPDPA